MISGNGRHRRPRQAPALIVAAGVAGSAIAIPLLGATSASAADTATWDKLAECESGGSWSADAGNGYYGGLQLSQQVWEEYGGLDFAPSADQASRSQQISVAEKVLDDQGISAWPSCAPIAGLTQDGAAADVDPGAPITTVPSDEPSESTEPGDGESAETGEPSASPSESADPSDDTKSSDKPSAKPSEKPDADDETRDKNHDESGEPGKSGESDESGDSGKSGQNDEASPAPGTPAGEGEGRHRGGSADDKASDGATREGSGRHASRGDERQKDGSDGTYTVRSGDSLWGIADDLDVKGGWAELYEENEKSVGSDPDLILPGQSLDLGEK
ncbi:resuscitation-promoting factor protein RpfC [Streptomyces durmitorensis]|uniref:Transglycosylase family protein n=1 Tax=Streptomyces durmitorensis TaxID=319947 RepID=A0ABY4PZ18_9ACTN|nr:transglycosylase family protein [Streptomyces durmitorensis]UQT58093.1 transglycosylase family protein [Streptomyces durmitorensis]